MMFGPREVTLDTIERIGRHVVESIEQFGPQHRLTLLWAETLNREGARWKGEEWDLHQAMSVITLASLVAADKWAAGHPGLWEQITSKLRRLA